MLISSYNYVNDIASRFYYCPWKIKIKKFPRPIYEERVRVRGFYRISNPHPDPLPHAGEGIYG